MADNASITSMEGYAMFQEMILSRYLDASGNPDVLVFWLTTTLCSLFVVFVPGGLT